MSDDSTIRVAIAGVRGRLGRVAFEAFAQASQVVLVGGLARQADPDRQVFDSLAPLLERGAQVLLDCTTRPGSVELAMAAVLRGVRPVIGASDWSADERSALERATNERGIGAMIVPNFSLGAVVMMALAERAAKFFPAAEIVEMHRVEKRDKPSGTALETARRLRLAGAAEPAIHSVRLPGMVAHQAVIFGGHGESLTIRHDSFSHESFVAGMLAAVRAVMEVRGLKIGLDSMLDA